MENQSTQSAAPEITRIEAKLSKEAEATRKRVIDAAPEGLSKIDGSELTEGPEARDIETLLAEARSPEGQESEMEDEAMYDAQLVESGIDAAEEDRRASREMKVL